MSRSLVQGVSVVACTALTLTLVPFSPRHIALGAGQVAGVTAEKMDRPSAGGAPDASAEGESRRAEQAAETESPQAGPGGQSSPPPAGATRPGTSAGRRR